MSIEKLHLFGVCGGVTEVHIQVRGQIAEGGSLLPPSLRSNSEHHAWQQAPLSSEPHCQPPK